MILRWLGPFLGYSYISVLSLHEIKYYHLILVIRKLMTFYEYAPKSTRSFSCLVLRITRYNLQVEYVNRGGADCYSQYGASWTLAASSRLAADGRRDEEGGGRSLLLNLSMVSELTVSGCSKFHSGIVLGKKECLYGSVEVRIILYLNLWEDLVLRLE